MAKGCPGVICHRQPAVSRRRSQRLDVHADQQREHGKWKEFVVASARARASTFGGGFKALVRTALKDALATPASVPTVWRAVRALGLTVKKNGPPARPCESSPPEVVDAS